MTIGSMAGYCDIHKIDKMFVGSENATEPVCVRCKADATPKTGRTQIVDDPGEAYFSGGKTNAKVSFINPGDQPAPQSDLPARILALGKTPVSVEAKFGEHINAALSWLRSIPMPKDIKQFKNLQKAITILESLESQNG